MAFKNITSSQHAAFVSALRAGQYNLLLGAGASMDSKNGFGELPSGNALKRDLSTLKQVPDSYSLQSIYGLLDADEVDRHVTARFSGATPGPTAQKLATFVWRRIFSWNIDDVLERVYRAGAGRQTLVPLHFSDPFEEADDLEKLLLVHLHGTVGTPEKGYVFSKNEYISNIRNISHWMVVLTQIMQNEPTIISGTSMDEVDLEYYLANRSEIASREDRGPSIFVEKQSNAIVDSMCSRHNLLQFQGHTKDFLEYCEEALPNRPTPYELIPLETRNIIPKGTTPSVAIAFQSDFEIVPATAPRSEHASRFLYGHVPTWQDLSSDVDVSRPIVASVIADVEARLANPRNETKLVLVTDVAGAGKTTILRRAAFELAKRSVRVFWCSALGKINSSTASVIDNFDEPVVLVVDNVADQASAVVELIERLEKPDVIILAGERSYRFKYLLTVTGSITMRTFDKAPLTSTEVERLIDQYLRFGIAGEYSASRNRRSFARNVSSDPIAIACCRIMNDFQPLNSIVRGLTENVSALDLKRYVLSAVARECNSAGVRYEVLSSAFGTVGQQDQLERDHPLPLAYSDAGKTFVVPENSTLGDRVLAFIAERDRKALLAVFVAFANSMAPRVNRTMIIRRSPEAKTAGRLFDYDDSIGKYLKEEADSFYLQTRQAWKWNSRYWEQVALLHLANYYKQPATEQGMAHLTEAVQHARHAVGVELHPFPLSTLGKVLMTQMLVAGNSMASIYDEAFKRLEKAIELESSWARSAPQPYASIFSGTTKYLAAGGVLNSKQTDRIQQFIIDAQNKFPRDPEVRLLLDNIGHSLL